MREDYKPLTDYHKTPNTLSKRRGQCKTCLLDHWKRYSATKLQNPEGRKHLRTLSRMSYRNNIEYHKKRCRIIEKTVAGKARKMVRSRVQSGALIKPKNCQNCHTVAQLDGHHEDYNKPLEVKWLCRLCHTYLHRITLARKEGQ